MVPLVWLLYTVIFTGVQGGHLVDLVEQVAGRGATRRVRRRRLPRDLRHDHPGRHRGGCWRCRWALWPRSTWSSTAAGGSRGPRHSWSTSWPVCRRSWRRCSSSRCGSRHGLPAERLRGVAGVGAVDASGRGAQHRRDAQAGSRRTARSLVRAGHSEMEDHRRGSSCPPRCPASSAASCWRWRG